MDYSSLSKEELIKEVATLASKINALTEVEKKAEENEKHFSLVLNNTGQVIFYIDFAADRKHKVRFVSDNIKDIFGLTKEQFEKENLAKYVHPDDVNQIGEYAKKLKEEKKAQIFLYRFKHLKKGKYFWVEEFITPQFDEKGNLIGNFGSSRDVTARTDSENALKQSESRFRTLAENALDVVYRYSLVPTPHYEYVSPSAQTVTGYAPEEFYNDPFMGFKITHPDDKHHAGDSEQILRDRGTAKKVSNGSIIMRWICKDGKIIWTETRNKPIKDETGKIIAIEGISRDITETKKAEEDLKQSEEKFRLLSLSAPVGIFLADNKGTPYYANKKMEEITGLPPERIINHNWLRLIHPEDIEKVSEKILRSIEKGLDYNDEFRVRNFALGARWVKFNAAAIRSASENKVTGWVGTIEDVTEARENELRIQESERALSTLMNNLPGMAYRCDYDEKWTMRFVSHGCFELTGYKAEDLKHSYRLAFSDIVLPEDRSVGKEDISKAIQNKSPFEIEYRIVAADGKTKWVWEKGEGVFDEKGKLLFLEGFITDITDRKRFETEIKQSHENYKTLIDSSPIGIFIHDEKGKILFVNDEGLKIMGSKNMKEFVGQNMLHFVLEEYHTGIRERKKQLLKGTKNLSFITTKMRRPDGKIIDVESRATRIIYEGKPAMQIVCQDNTLQRELEIEKLRTVVAEETNIKLQREINERRNAERVLNETQKYTRMLIESSIDMICATDKEGYLTEFNLAAQKSFGYKLDEVLGKHVSMLYENPKERIKITDNILYRDGTFAGEVVNKKKNGETFTAFLSASVLRNEKGEIIGAMGVSRDISEIKKADNELRESYHFIDSVLENIPNMIYVKELKDFRFLRFNKAGEELIGFSKEELLGKNDYDFFPKKQADFFYERDLKALKGKSLVDTPEEPIKTKYKGTRILHTKKIPILDEKGNPKYLLGISEDITESRKAEEELRSSEERYRDLFENATDLIQSVNIKGDIIYVNDAWRKTLGYSKKEIAHMNILDIIHPEYRVHCKTMMKSMGGGKVEKIEKMELAFLTKNKKTVLVEGNVNLKKLDGKPVATRGIFRNITERRLAEEKIQESEARLKAQAIKMNAIIENSSHVIWSVDTNKKLTLFNKNYIRLTKILYDVVPKVGQMINRGRLKSDTGFNEFWESKYDEAFMGKSQHFETSLTDKKNITTWREIYLNPIYDEKGKVIEVSGIAHDISEKRLAEEKIVESLREKEILLKEVHHRVKNNMQVISSILNLQSSYVKDKNTLNILKESQNRIKSMAFIHESLYQTKDFSKINFSEYVTNLSRNLVHSYEVMEGKILLNLNVQNIFLNLDQSIPCGLIINELISNSLKYAFKGKKKGIIGVEIKQKSDNIVMSISDNGVGLPKKIDFRNTDSLGLQLVTTLTEQIDGTISLDNKKGTKFTIRFKQRIPKQRI